MKICVRAHDLEVKGTDQIISGLRDAGADGIQLVCYKSYEDIKQAPAGITPAQATQIGKSFADAGLCIALLGAYFNPVHSDDKKVETDIRIFRDYLEVGSLLGCSVVGSETGSYQDEPWIYHPKNRTKQALDRVAEVFRNLCDFAAGHNAVVGMEGASGHVCYSVDALDKATALIARDNLKIIFDLLNLMDSSNYREYIGILERGLDAFAGRIHCFHIKDCTWRRGELRQCAVGKGDLDFNVILRMIKKYDDNAVLVLEGTPRDDVKKSIAFLRYHWQRA